MNILMILENEFPYDERVEKEALSLIKAGHSVTIACATITGKEERENYKGITIRRAQTDTFIYKKARVACLTLPFYFNFWLKFVTKVIKEDTYDAIHVHDLPLAKVGIKLSKKYRLRLTMDFHENYPYMLKEETYTQSFTGKILAPIGKWIKYEQKTLRSIENAVCVCDEMAKRLSDFNPNVKFHILDNTLNTNDYSKPKVAPKKESSPIKLVYVGGFTIKRGIEVAIKGIEIANRTNETKFALDLYGNGRPEYIESLLQLAKDKKVSDYVKFKGYLNLPQDAEKLMTYHIGLIPHLKNTHTDNTSPNKIFHYAYYNLPVFCSDCNYLKRIIDETKGGAYYKNTSAEDFAKQLIALNNSGKLEEYGQSGYNSIINKYNWEMRVNSLIKLYEN